MTRREVFNECKRISSLATLRSVVRRVLLCVERLGVERASRCCYAGDDRKSE